MNQKKNHRFYDKGELPYMHQNISIFSYNTRDTILKVACASNFIKSKILRAV